MTNLFESDILACYDFLAHEKQTELRLINPNNQNEPALSLFVSSKEDFFRLCKTYNGQINIYAGINERVEGGTKKEHIVSIKTIVVDIDAIKPKGEAATERELAKADKVANKIIVWFDEMGFIKPVKCMSGNGYQLWCAMPKIDIDNANRDTIESQVKTFYKLLITSFSGQGAQIDNIGDLPRIIKVIGTKSIKGTATKARPHRISHCSNDFKRVEDQKLKEFILSLEAKAPASVVATTSPEVIVQFETQAVFLEQALADKKLADLFYGRLTSQYQSRSEAEMALLCKLVWWGFSEMEIRHIMQQSKIGKWSDKRTTEHYRGWQLKQALGFITETRQVQKDYPEEEIESKIKEKPTLISKKFELLTYLDFERMKKDKRFLVEEFLYPKTVNMLFSPPGQFKSILAMHLAMQVANGKRFMNLKTTKYPVLLCDKENNNQLLKTRLFALRKGHRIKSKRFPLFILSRNGDLFDSRFLDELKTAIRENGIKLVIFDTLHRFADYEENKADDINRIYTTVFQPIVESYDCSILFLHHTTKEGVYRGSSDLLGMIDTSYSIKRRGKENFMLSCEKSRFGEIEKICGQIVFGKDDCVVTRGDEETQDLESKTKFMDAVREIISLFSIKGDNLARSFIAAEFEIRKERDGMEIGKRTMDKALQWLAGKGKIEKLKAGKYRRKWVGDFTWD